MPAKGKTNLAPSIPAKSRSASYHSKGLWAKKAKFGNKWPAAKPKTAKAAAHVTSEKKVKKGTRTVVRPRLPRNFTNQPDGTVRGSYASRVPKIRASVAPGRVCIVLAGKYAGRRVVVVKALQSGLVVVTGPSSLNSVPLRRVNPTYLIATSVRLDFAKEKIYSILNKNKDTINDKLFEREKGKLRQAKKELTEEEKKARTEKIAAAKKEGTSAPKKIKTVLKQPRTSVNFKRTAGTEKKLKALSEKAKQRKAIQKELDTVLLKEVKKTPLLGDYLGARFQLQNGQYPHELKF
jgi:large subunit ribosomal protein L6e